MTIVAHKKILENNDFLKNIENLKIVESEKEIPTKTTVFLTERKNEYIIPYDYGKNVIGKNEYVLRWGLGCIYSCVYCYSKLKHKTTYIALFPDIFNIKKEINALKRKEKNILLNAGENYDSMILENKIPFCKHLSLALPDDILIEFRTKAIVPKAFIKEANKKNSLIAFSVNPEYIRKNYEINAPSLKSIINNINELLENGFKVALRIEPIILIKNYEKLYFEFINFLNENINLKALHSVDIALLRFTKKGLKNVKDIKEIYVNEWIYNKNDGKFRYFIKLRYDALKKIKNYLENFLDREIYIGGEPLNFIEKFFKN
jgi:spore photoproduct lyase